MARIFLCVVLVAAVAAAAVALPFDISKSEDFGIPALSIKQDYKKVACASDNTKEREKLIEESKCGKPKPVFVHLEPRYHFEQVIPRAVWVNRCVGLCEFSEGGSCVATETVIRHIPIRIYNGKTYKETCATYPVEEHVSCGCCALGPGGCSAPKVFNPRKCNCQCPNMEERRTCLKKRNRRWNRSKCTCEPRRHPRV